MWRRRPTQAEYVTQAERLFDQGRHQDLTELLEQALARYPEDPELLLQKAMALVHADSAAARDLAVRSVTLDPGNPWKLGRVAELMFELDDIPAARDYARQTINAAPDDFGAMAAIVHLAGKIE